MQCNADEINNVKTNKSRNSKSELWFEEAAVKTLILGRRDVGALLIRVDKDFISYDTQAAAITCDSQDEKLNATFAGKSFCCLLPRLLFPTFTSFSSPPPRNHIKHTTDLKSRLSEA